MTANQPGDSAPADESETYDLADDPAPPDASDLAAPRSLPPAVPAAPAAPVLNYGGGRAQPRQPIEDLIEGSPVKDFYLPIALCLVGTAVLYGRAAWGADSLRQFTSAVGLVAAYVVWNLVVMLVGIVIAAKLADVGFGGVTQALLKLAALTVAPLAAGVLAHAIVGGIWGEFAALAVSTPVYWWLFAYLFDLDFRETMICVGVIIILKIFSFFVIRGSLLALG